MHFGLVLFLPLEKHLVMYNIVYNVIVDAAGDECLEKCLLFILTYLVDVHHNYCNLRLPKDNESL